MIAQNGFQSPGGVSGTAAIGAVQSPWVTDINGGAHNLTNAGTIACTGMTSSGNIAANGQQCSVLRFLASGPAGAGAATYQWGIDGSGTRWNFRIVGTESGSNAGSDLTLTPYSDAVSPLSTALTITRSNGYMTVGSKLGVGAFPSISGTGSLHAVGDTARPLTVTRTPANSAAPGNDGEICWDASFIYVRMGGSWRRAAIATF